MDSQRQTTELDAPISTPNVEEEVAEPPRVPIARYNEFFNQRTFSTEWRKTVKDDKARKAYRKKPVLIVRRLIDERGQLKGTLVNVMSPALRETLKTLYGSHVNVSEVKPEVPHKVLFHSRNHFRKKLDEERSGNAPDKDLVFELEAIVNLIEEDHGATAIDVERLISEGRITFELLWALFPPGCLVYRRHPQLNQHQVMRHQRADYTMINGVLHFQVICDVISNDGNHFGLSRIVDNIKEFSDTVRIQDLDFLPLQQHPDHESIYAHVVRRGSSFAQLEQQLFETSGRAYEEILNPSRPRSEQKEPRIFTANGRVMINSATFRMFEPNNSINRFVYRPLENRYSLSDEELAICSPVVVGFCFGNKKWGGFALENLKDVNWSDTAFDSLVLGDEKKLVIRALIQQHSSRNDTFDDVISGKGRGLVGLLCGNPGCGKTLTAEAVAEAARMPLYVVGAGDLGTTAKEVDDKLVWIFELATRWNAVVLLDEADVFLHKRTPLAIEQNALVAVFLRHLEYYQGILIMTTNMNANFDPAFESRIHFCMHYSDLDQNSRKIIWKNFLRRAMGDQKPFTEEQYDYLADYELNGRQIKNTVSVAFSLAAEEKAPLTIRHVELVLDTKAHWDKKALAKTSQRKPITLPVRGSMLLFAGCLAFIGITFGRGCYLARK